MNIMYHFKVSSLVAEKYQYGSGTILLSRESKHEKQYDWAVGTVHLGTMGTVHHRHRGP